MQITAACPAHMMDAANHLAMVYGASPADANTYIGPLYQDAAGNLYSVASWLAPTGWETVALKEPLVRPEWDVDSVIDMDAATDALHAIVFSLHPIVATGDKLTCIGGMEPLEALSAMGLTMDPLWG